MAASGVRSSRLERASLSPDQAPALGGFAEAALQTAASTLSRKVDEWVRTIEDYTASEGATGRGFLEGLKAHLLGKNPVWMAMKGAWRGASVRARVVAVLVLVLFLLLAPVTLVVLLLGLLVAAVVTGIRAAAQG